MKAVAFITKTLASQRQGLHPGEIDTALQRKQDLEGHGLGEYFGHLIRWANSLEKTPMQEEKGVTEDEMVGLHYQLNGQRVSTASGRW